MKILFELFLLIWIIDECDILFKNLFSLLFNWRLLNINVYNFLHPYKKLIIPFEDEYVCGLQTHLLIVSFWTFWDWFSVMNCVVFFSYCIYFMCRFRWCLSFILWVWTIFYIECTLKRIEARCCRNLHVKYCNNWKIQYNS